MQEHTLKTLSSFVGEPARAGDHAGQMLELLEEEVCRRWPRQPAMPDFGPGDLQCQLCIWDSAGRPEDFVSHQPGPMRHAILLPQRRRLRRRRTR